MSRSNHGSKQHNNKPKPKPKQTPVLREIPIRKTDDAFKFASYAIRKLIASVSGRNYGDTDFDNVIGNAVGQFVNSEEICKFGTAQAIGIHAACGAWEAVKRGN